MSKTPIHPIYKQECDRSELQSPILLGVIANAMETKDYSQIQALRAAGDEQLSKIPLPDIIKTTKEVTGGPDNVNVKLVIYRPIGSEDEILPIILYFHGGGYMFGSTYTHGKSVIDFANSAHAAVIFVDYSLSPEAQFPLAIEEGFAALSWVRENAAEINGDPEKIVVLGDSAGGNLSAVLSLMARDRGLKDAIKAQVLIYPYVSDSDDFPSRKVTSDEADYFISSDILNAFITNYFPVPVMELKNPYGTPLILPVEKLTDLPPALVLTAECDGLRDEGEAYYSKLLEAGNDAIGVRVLGAIHGFMTIQGPPQYRFGLNTCVSFIKDKLDI
ncbi:hypothetical protein K501DRAFT_338867 [Backusella circina FSU 941]|nr:hypothetical protein K501DRAFT_338867 [Backusella circina FSU 941]